MNNICKYCKSHNMTKEEYKQFKLNIQVTAQAIRSTLIYQGGMYYPVSNLFKFNSNNDMKAFIIDELKKLNIEFREDNTEYRVIQ